MGNGETRVGAIPGDGSISRWGKPAVRKRYFVLAAGALAAGLAAFGTVGAQPPAGGSPKLPPPPVMPAPNYTPPADGVRPAGGLLPAPSQPTQPATARPRM